MMQMDMNGGEGHMDEHKSEEMEGMTSDKEMDM